jgi:hypothetical protein
MGALTRVGMLVQGRAVESGQRPAVAREMGRDPVDDDPETGAMEFVDQVLEVVRGSEAAGRGVESGDLVSPAGEEGVLRDREELDVGESGLLEVLDQGFCQWTS